MIAKYAMSASMCLFVSFIVRWFQIESHLRSQSPPTRSSIGRPIRRPFQLFLGLTNPYSPTLRQNLCAARWLCRARTCCKKRRHTRPIRCSFLRSSRSIVLQTSSFLGFRVRQIVAHRREEVAQVVRAQVVVDVLEHRVGSKHFFYVIEDVRKFRLGYVLILCEPLV